MDVVSPVGRVSRQTHARPAVVSDVRGKRVAILNNGWSAMGPIADQLGRRLKEDYGAASVFEETFHLSHATPADLLGRVARDADLVIVGLAT